MISGPSSLCGSQRSRRRGAAVSTGAENTILAFVALAAVALAIQTIGIIATLLVARKAARNVREEMEHYRSKVMPIIQRAQEVVEKVAPKVESAAEELSAITTRLREQTAEVQLAANDIISRTQNQVGRVDHMVTAVFDRVERAGAFVSGAVSKPMRQLSGFIASFRAVVDTLRESDGGHRSRPPRTAPHYSNVEPFVEPVVEPVEPVPPVSPEESPTIIRP